MLTVAAKAAVVESQLESERLGARGGGSAGAVGACPGPVGPGAGRAG